MSRSAEFVVVGGGAAGLSAAWAAARRGHSVVLVERERFGGDCTWTGCVPSKALLEQARAVHAGRQVGLTGEVPWSQVIGTVRERRERVALEEDAKALREQGIEPLTGSARFIGPKVLDVDGTRVEAERAVVIATGTTPLMPPVDGLDGVGALTNDSVFEIDRQPRRLAIMGGGPIGLELGQAFQRLGTQVTVLEGADRVAGKEEPETSEVLTEVLRREGVQIELGAYVSAARREGDEVVLTTEDGRTTTADEVLVAVGRRPVTEGLDVERGGVELDDRGFVVVDDKMRTSAEGVYAVGDITGGLQFTHVGYDQGSLAVSNELGLLKSSFEPASVPWATFTDPEVGRVGMTEAQAHEAHGDAARVAYMPIAETDRAKASGELDGFVKLIAGPHTLVRGLAGGNLIGATVVCPTGGDVIHELALAVKQHVITGRVAQLVHAYPSWSLAVRETAAQFFFEYKGREARPARPGG